jgi:hypothetical protein
VLFIFTAVSATARVLRVEIASRSDVLNGKVFGDVGAYERIQGRVYFSVSVTNPHNRRIVDLAKAENLKNGDVEFSADFVALRPKNTKKATVPCYWKCLTAVIAASWRWWTEVTGM